MKCQSGIDVLLMSILTNLNVLNFKYKNWCLTFIFCTSIFAVWKNHLWILNPKKFKYSISLGTLMTFAIELIMYLEILCIYVNDIYQASFGNGTLSRYCLEYSTLCFPNRLVVGLKSTAIAFVCPNWVSS